MPRHVAMAGEAVLLGPAPAAQSYLRSDKILQAAIDTGTQAIHPGYGFLSENAGFAEECSRHGIVFIGPTARNMRDFGLKHTARALAISSDVPVSPGTDLLGTVAEASAAAARIGYPVMIKSTAGGGGIGMQLAKNSDELAEKFESVQRMAASNFKSSGLFLEKFIASARHVEVQIFGDGEGTIAVLGERDCSASGGTKKFSKKPRPQIFPRPSRQRLHAAARRLGEAARYRSAGTCEFMYDFRRPEFYFLEVNTRLQVEHCVTEEVSGLDLVEWMIRLAARRISSPRGLHARAKRPLHRGPHLPPRMRTRTSNPAPVLLTEVSFPRGRARGWLGRALGRAR